MKKNKMKYIKIRKVRTTSLYLMFFLFIKTTELVIKEIVSLEYFSFHGITLISSTYLSQSCKVI